MALGRSRPPRAIFVPHERGHATGPTGCLPSPRCLTGALIGLARRASLHEAWVRRFLLAVVMLAAACGSDSNPFVGSAWRLVALGPAASPAAAIGDATIEFTTTADVTGWTGCNAYGAAHQAGELKLRLDDLIWTEAGCPSEALFRQEQRMQDALATVERFEVGGTTHAAQRRRARADLQARARRSNLTAIRPRLSPP
ncbi:MAG: META domain-containing protein [Chloroflexi bacterium]|nr:META domain-containing protein [Chloroflexota bacterium]